MAVNEASLNRTIKTWLETVTSLDNQHIVLDNQSVKPDAPFIAFNPSFSEENYALFDYDEFNANTEQMEYSGLRRRVISITAYGENAKVLMSLARNSLDRDHIVKLFRQENIGIVDRGKVLDFAYIEDKKEVPAANLDIKVLVPMELEGYDIDYFNKLHLTTNDIYPDPEQILKTGINIDIEDTATVAEPFIIEAPTPEINYSYRFRGSTNIILDLYFNDSDGTVTNATGSNNGTLNNTNIIHEEVLGETSRYVGPFTSPDKIEIPHNAVFNDLVDFTIEYFGELTDITAFSRIVGKERYGFPESWDFNFSYNNFIANTLTPFIRIYDTNGSSPALLVYNTDFNQAANQKFYFGVSWSRTTKTFTMVHNTTVLSKAVYAPNSSFHSSESAFNGNIRNTTDPIRIGINADNSTLPAKAKYFRLRLTKEAKTAQTMIDTAAIEFGMGA